jgi:hypothetical protein
MSNQNSEVVKIDKWTPSYAKHCCVCGADHVVTGVIGDKVVYKGDMCGVCTWGEADAADPDNW